MGDFFISNREYASLPELLKEVAPSFPASDEFCRLDPADVALPSVVSGAFTRYVERLHSEAANSAPSTRSEVAEAHRAIERLASSTDREVVNTLVVEIFEHLDLASDGLEDFYKRLGPSARSLYDKWIGRPRW